MKKSINIWGTIATGIMTFIGLYLSKFSSASFILVILIILLWMAFEYLLKCNNELDGLNNQLSNKNTNLKDDIKVLNQKISQISIVANQGSPYKIILLSNPDICKGINKHKEYTVEIIVSTIDKQYDIKYLNISFNNRVVFTQNNIITQNNMYKITSNYARQRNKRYEYNLELADNYLDRICAKCAFKLKYELKNDLNMNVEVNSDNGINKIETFNYTIISS